jgi:hypothetical protein
MSSGVVLSFNVPIATATMAYTNEGAEKTIAVSGVIDPGSFGIPGFTIFDANAKVAAMASTSGHWHLDFAAKAKIQGVGIDGEAHMGNDGATIEANVNLGATSFAATGEIDPQGHFSLSATQTFSSGAWNYGFGSIRLEGDTTVTVSDTGAATDGSLKGCYKLTGQNWHCDSIGGGASFEISGGKVRACGDINVPGVGSYHKCTSISF